MRMRTRRGWAAVLLPVVALSVIGLVAAPANAAPTAPVTNQADIVDQLRAIPGLTIVSEGAAPAPEYRFFMLTYRQPVDHRRPSAGTFEQRFQLLHKDTSRPMVLHTSGYNVRTTAFRSEPTRLIDGNQVSTEQRFFTPSRPNPADWSTLDIWQAASDHHRLVRALKPIYSAKWISTGASKGGMTSVYHRRFYPNDVDGVVAYVAPNDRVNPADTEYDEFFTEVGTNAACRQALDDLQKEALTRRAEFVARYAAYAADNGLTFDEVFGNADKAFEMTVLDTVWAFWQYSGEAACSTVPARTASSDDIWDFIDANAGFAFYTDEQILFYAPYFYQAATQLGWPAPKFAHLKGLRHYPTLYQANSSLPPSLQRRHDALPMLDVDLWVRTQASEMLFVYGANDPWGAEPFFPSWRDSHSYTAAGANHGANIAALTAADAAAATATLRRWAGVTPAASASARTATSVESVGAAPNAVLDGNDPRYDRAPIWR